MLAAPVTSIQYWQELGERESHSILVAVQIGTDSLESKLGTGVKGYTEVHSLLLVTFSEEAETHTKIMNKIYFEALHLQTKNQTSRIPNSRV